jgi:hypothetical protein
MPTAPKVRVLHAVDAADATAIAVNAASVPNVLKMANARLIEMASRLHKLMRTATTTDRAKAVKVDAAAVAGAAAMTVARVWTKPETRYLRHEAKTTPMHRRQLKAVHAKAWTTATAVAAVHATAMAASVARVVAVMLAQRTRKSKLQATSKCASLSEQARTAKRRCARISHKRRQRPAWHPPRWRRMPMWLLTLQPKMAQLHRLAHRQRRLLSQ